MAGASAKIFSLSVFFFKNRMKTQTKNTAELSEMLMQHSYFLEEPGKSMTRPEVSLILNAHLQRKGAYHVDRLELERCIQILLSEEYLYADPISILSDIHTFSFGICQLHDTRYTKKKEKEQQTWLSQEQRWEREHIARYANEPAYRQMLQEYRQHYGSARKNDQGVWEIYDASYHHCWCILEHGKLFPIKNIQNT